MKLILTETAPGSGNYSHGGDTGPLAYWRMIALASDLILCVRVNGMTIRI